MDLPAELDRREKCLAKLQAARAQIEAEAAQKAREHTEEIERRRQERAAFGDEEERGPEAVISRLNSPAYAYPCQRFAYALTNADA